MPNVSANGPRGPNWHIKACTIVKGRANIDIDLDVLITDIDMDILMRMSGYPWTDINMPSMLGTTNRSLHYI